MLSIGVHGHAGSKAELVASEICRKFTGIFRWDAPGLPQFVTMQIREIAVPAGSTVVLKGIGRYVVYLPDNQVSLTNIEFRWEIDAPSLNIVMREMNPDTDSFITDGDYRGRISSDLQIIQATWRTRGTQDTGVLQLRAATECRAGV